MTNTTTAAELEQELAHKAGKALLEASRSRGGDIAVDRFAGMTFKDWRDAQDFCKVIAHAIYTLPAYLKNNPTDCLVITTQALRWRLEPVWVMQNSYVARAEGVSTYDNFVFGAVLNASNMLKTRPRYTYEGMGDERTCTVSALFKGEAEPHTLTTPPLKQCRPKRNERGEVKGSALWDKDPDQQLGYYAIRNFARRHIPELLGGVWARDEFEGSTQDADDPPEPKLREVPRFPVQDEVAEFERINADGADESDEARESA